ncbi:hypothetical protein Curi_c02740 [Gottschalkia acidurici 9a]|uniref:Uncharacterized protein n=1 Tax=Gottschalkia acidurici (strain ATCC 7906 / DSM 604 / BCRC 14475 / CIP 104303 / KCTC 5404 / NCIMB 10678 / 9a) TaxID=1128398 RepID=K0AVQ0_GOTA9|nr:hypothetical protein [Gottschalkia acidurici]AFS77354.1 hypothetical protein Curi_c02740 [Gottschalkia acidurici 9a]
MKNKNYVETKEDLINIANNCTGYNYEGKDNFTSSLSAPEGTKSCINCAHLYKDRCQVDLMRVVWSSIN